jgi:hypothetical protein
MSLESDGGMILTGENRRTLRKTCPSATLSTTNPTQIVPGSNPGLRGERPATNHLSHGTTNSVSYEVSKRVRRVLRYGRNQSGQFPNLNSRGHPE